MRHNLNLNPHVILPQPRNTHTSPNRLMTGTILMKIPHHGRQRLVINRHMVRVDSENLAPALPAGVAQVVLDIIKGLVDLRVNFFVEFACFSVPAAFPLPLILILIFRKYWVNVPCPAHSMRSPMRTAWLYLKFLRLRSPTPL